MSMSSTKREIRQFHVEVMQRRQRNVQKSLRAAEEVSALLCCYLDNT